MTICDACRQPSTSVAGCAVATYAISVTSSADVVLRDGKPKGRTVDLCSRAVHEAVEGVVNPPKANESARDMKA